MKAGWYKARIGDLAIVQSGSGFPTKYQGKAGEAIPFYKVSDMNIVGNERAMIYENNSITEAVRKTLRASIFPAGSIIFPKIGGAIATNKKRLTTRDCCVDNNVMGVIPRIDKIDSEFLYYFFLQHDLSEFANEAALPSIKKTVVEDWVMCIPKALSEQQRIVSILDEALEGIATAKANAEKNLQNARALFESHLHSVFTHQGNGWEEKSLGDVCEYVNGKAHEQCIDENGQFIVINSKFISSEGKVFKKSNQALLLLQPGDIAMVLSDVPNGKALAKCYLVEHANTFTLNQRICLIRSTQFHTKFLFYQLNRNTHFLSFDNGENQTNMRLNQILSCPLFLPPVLEQESIADRLDAISEETQHLESIHKQKLAALDELKKSLLHQAFNGEL